MLGTDLGCGKDYSSCIVMMNGIPIGHIKNLETIKLDTGNTYSNEFGTFTGFSGTFTLRKTSVEFKMLMRSVTHGKQDGKYKHYKRIVNRKKLTHKLKAKGRM